MNAEYRSMMAKHRKAITEVAKRASRCPWDYGPGIDMLVHHLRFMKDYYDLGVNVIADDSPCDDHPSDRPNKTRSEMLGEILHEYDEWMSCEDKYWWGETEFPGEDDDGHSDIQDRYVMHTKYEDPQRNMEEFVRECDAHRHAFFDLLAQYVEYLWD